MSIHTSLSRVIARQSLKVKHNSPHMLFVAGTVGIVASTVLACRATLKLERTLEKMQDELEDAKQDGILVSDTGRNQRKDVAVAYGKGSFELAKLYAPAIAVGGVSLIALTGSHVQLTRRNTALTVAYTGLHQAYQEYRKRIQDHLGEEKERDLYHGVKLEEVQDEKGKTKAIKVVDPNGLSPYAKFFDEHSSNWYPDPELNRLFVQCQQNYANQLLLARGHLFLNEVYDMLDIGPRTSAGQIVGWVVGDDGDNFVDFGLFDCASSRFVNGMEQSILLDFNVDGVIMDKI